MWIKKTNYSLYNNVSLVIFFFILIFFITKYPVYDLKIKDSYVLKSELNAPVISKKGGLYKNNFYVKIKNPFLQGKVYYSLDGSSPSFSSKIYYDSILIKQNKNKNTLIYIPSSPRWKAPVEDFQKLTILKAAVYIPGIGFSKIKTESYGINIKHNLPVISISTDNSNLFDKKYGIYILGDKFEKKDFNLNNSYKKWWDYPANYKERGKNWERPAHIELFNKKGEKLIDKNVYLRIHGNLTRAYPQKSLRLIFKEEALHFNLFNSNTNDFYSIILRNSGNDWNKTLFRDALQHILMNNSNNITLAYKPVIVYINGEFWGIYNIREHINSQNFAYKFKSQASRKKDIIILEQSWSKITGNNKKEIKKYIEFIKNINSLTYKEIINIVDINNFIDYIAAEIFFANTDWPENNVKFFKMNKKDKWKFILYDLDYGMGYYGNTEGSKINVFNKLKKSYVSIALIFNRLSEFKEFKHKFYNRFLFLLQNNLNYNNINAKIDSLKNILYYDMPKQIKRWREPSSMKQWEENINRMKEFSINREKIIISQLKEWKTNVKRNTSKNNK